MSKKYLYYFSEGNDAFGGDKVTMKNILGGKGAGLAEMTAAGMPVPQGFTITTEACTQYYADGRQINDEITADIFEHVKGLIGTARAERDGTLIFQPAAGIVRAQFEWEDEQEAALTLPTEQLTGRQTVRRTLFWNGQSIALPSLHPVPTASEAKAVIRHDQPEAFGIPFPCFIEETSYYYKEVVDLERTEDQTLAIARLQSKQALQANWPDFELLARKEDVSVEESTLHYRVVYTIVANICK